MSVFFAPDFEQHLTHFQLNEDESKHCVKVLRMQVGAEIRLINGRGLEAICQIPLFFQFGTFEHCLHLDTNLEIIFQY